MWIRKPKDTTSDTNQEPEPNSYKGTKHIRDRESSYTFAVDSRPGIYNHNVVSPYLSKYVAVGIARSGWEGSILIIEK